MKKKAKFNRLIRYVFEGVLVLFVFFSFIACPDNDGGNDDKYDPRNITRIDNHLEVQPELVVTSEGYVHLVYHGGIYDEARDVYYIWKNDDEWSEPVNLSNSDNDSRVPQIAIDTQDNLHVVWEEDGEGNGRTMFTMKESNVDWTEPMYITENENDLPQIATDENNNVHVMGMGFGINGTYRRMSNGVWEPEENIPYNSNPSMAVSKDGDVHIVRDVQPYPIIYFFKNVGGNWSDNINVTDTEIFSWVPDVTVDESEIIYISWTEKYTDQIKIRMKYPDGSWSEIDSIPGMEGDPWLSQLAVDGNGLHVVWNAHTDEWDFDIYLQTRTHDGIWLERQQLSRTPSASLGQGIFLMDNALHIAWLEKYDRIKNSNSDIYYVKVTISN